MARQYHPFINPTSGLPECLYAGCGREIPSDHYLCKTHYARLSEGSVGPCPGRGCKRFKSSEYDCCATCAKLLEPERDPAWDAGDVGCTEFFSYLLVSADRRLVPGPHPQPAQPGVAPSGRPVPDHPGRRLPPGVVRGLFHPGRGGRAGARAQAPGGHRPLRRPGPGVRLPGPHRAGAPAEGAWLSGELARTRAGDVLRKTPRSVRMPASNRPRSPKRSGVYL